MHDYSPHGCEALSIKECPCSDIIIDAELDNLVSLFGFDIVADNNNNMVNGCPLAVQHMLQQHQVATFNGMKDPANQVSLKTELIDHAWVKHKEHST